MVHVKSRPFSYLPVVFVLVLGLAAVTSRAQRADVPIEPRRLAANDKALLEQLGELRDAGKLMSMDDVRAALASPKPRAITLAPAATEPLPTTEIAVRGRQSLLRIGWFYLCHRCNNWHTLYANGYPLTADGVAASCYHVLEPKDNTMREGYLFAMSTGGEVYPITAVLAADEKLDAVIFRMEGSGFTPVALNDQNSPGERVYLVSDPRSVAGYFSAGHINRFYWDGNKRDGDLNSLEDVRSLRIDVSTPWSPGSSGAAIMDEFGNAIGHVTKIMVERENPAADAPAPPVATSDPSTQPATQPAMRRSESYLIVLHEAVPARGVRLLVEAMNNAAHANGGR